MAVQNSLLPVPQAQEESLPPAPSAGVTPTDIQRVGHFLDSSVSDNTRAVYRSAWKNFQKWAQGRATLTMPASPATVASYLSHLVDHRNLSVATVRLHRAALAAIHKAGGHEDPTDNEGVRRVIKGIARTRGRAQKQARPLTAEALAAIRATAPTRRPLGDGKKQESAERASWRGRMDLALLSVLRDGLLRRSEAAALTWGDIEIRENGTALITVRRSKTDPTAEGVTLFIGQQAGEALQAIRPADELLDPRAKVFGLSPQQIGRRVKAAAQAASLGEAFTGHSGRVGMAQDLAKTGAELPALMNAGRWKSSTMPARYTEPPSRPTGVRWPGTIRKLDAS